MATRITHETIYVRHDFTDAERLQMGSELAEAHQHLATIEDEEKTMKAQFNERKAGANQRLSSLSRTLAGGFEMRNVRCELKWDAPNVGEVSYIGSDGKVERTRAMAPSEHQQELEFVEEEAKPTELAPEAETASVLESAKNAAEFFDSAANAEKGKPSAEDLDTVAEEQEIADATGTPDEKDKDEAWF